MMNQKKDQEKSTSLDSKKIPRWLQGTVSPGRRELEIDYIEGDGTAKNTTKGGVPFRWKVFKRTQRRIAEMEELHEWIEKKHENSSGSTEAYLDSLEKTLNSMVE